MTQSLEEPKTWDVLGREQDAKLMELIAIAYRGGDSGQYVFAFGPQSPNALNLRLGQKGGKEEDSMIFTYHPRTYELESVDGNRDPAGAFTVLMGILAQPVNRAEVCRLLSALSPAHILSLTETILPRLGQVVALQKVDGGYQVVPEA